MAACYGDGMQRKRRTMIAATLAALSLFAGCTAAEPEPTVAPRSVGPAPTSTRTPEPTPTVPTTVKGPTGVDLEFVPSDPAWTPACRPATKDERARVLQYVRNGTTWERIEGTPQVVDLPDDGWYVVAFWIASGDSVARFGAVSGSGAVSGVPLNGWTGTHTFGGAAFEDGPAALRTALECLDA